MTYYIDVVNGNDNNGGTTRNNPWKTFTRVLSTMLQGDSVIVLPGNYPAQRLIITKPDLSFIADGNVTLHGGFRINGVDYISITGFDITDTYDSTSYSINGAGIYVDGKYCNIENNYIHYAVWNGVVLSSTSESCVVRNNKLYRNGQNGADIGGKNHLVEGNEVWDTIQYHPSILNPPTWLDANGMVFFGSGHIFRKNYIHDIKFDPVYNINPHIDCFQTWGDANHITASNILFEQNLCDNIQAQSQNEVGQGFMIEKDAGDNPTNITIKNNIIRAYRCLNILDAQNLIVVNNTFVNDLNLTTDYYPTGIGLTNTPSAIIKNNIFYDMTQHSIILRDTISQTAQTGNNLEYRSDSKPLVVNDSYYSATRRAKDLWGVNPLIVSGANKIYRLQSNSPAINAGETLSYVTNDFDDNLRPQSSGYDIGAYEGILMSTIVNLTGISTGNTEIGTITLTATTSNVAVIPSIIVNYTSPSTTGTLTLTAGVVGTAIITVTVTTNLPINNVISKTFTVTVKHLNNPTLDNVSDIIIYI
jgi:hypothetical protein